jgi:hypothetical protein
LWKRTDKAGKTGRANKELPWAADEEKGGIKLLAKEIQSKGFRGARTLCEYIACRGFFFGVEYSQLFTDSLFKAYLI